MLKSIFWNAGEHRLRAGWRVIVFLLISGVLVNSLIILLRVDDDANMGQVAVNVLVAASMMVALLINARWIDKRRILDFGLEGTAPALKEGLVGIALAVFSVGVVVGVGMIAGWMEVTQQMVSAMVGYSFGIALLSQIARYLAGSFFEELLSRSILLRAIAEGFNRSTQGNKRTIIAAWIMTSLLFGLLHLANPNATLLGALNVSLLGGAFGLGFVMTGRLALAIGLHAGWNLAQNVLFGMPNSGKPAQVLIWEAAASGPDLITGGAFGIEGGLLGTLATALMVGATWAWLRSAESKPHVLESLSLPPAR